MSSKKSSRDGWYSDEPQVAWAYSAPAMNLRLQVQHIPTSPAQRTDHREEADGYRGEVFRRGDLRIAECRDGLQWLLQRERPTRTAGGAAWRTLAYCVTRKALTRLYTAHSGAPVPELAELPETINRGKGG